VKNATCVKKLQKNEHKLNSEQRFGQEKKRTLKQLPAASLFAEQRSDDPAAGHREGDEGDQPRQAMASDPTGSPVISSSTAAAPGPLLARGLGSPVWP